MKLKTVVIPEQTFKVGWRGKITTIPEREHTYAPTLATVHNYLHGDWGPFYLSWRDKELCPFDSQVDWKNMTCSEGRRKRCGGLLIKSDTISHLPPSQQRRTLGRVICYEWCHRLSNVYWDIQSDELLKMPDDPSYVACVLMRRVFRESGWQEWIREKKRRKDKRKRFWLKPLETRKELYG